MLHSLNTIAFVACAKAVGLPSDDEGMPVSIVRVERQRNRPGPSPGCGPTEKVGDLLLGRRRCQGIAPSPVGDLASQTPTASALMFKEFSIRCLP
jgi:hypothetical protein